uniref:C2H2-type domain-containing protein n=1 Tax=Trichogramma kaykai TaxID=54128 RepID=A0ABD2W0S4_9HYME
MESRKDLVSVKEEPCDDWEDVANESVDPEVPVKTENSDESSSQQKKDEDILIECESVLVKHEPKPSLTTIYQATVKEENSEFLVKTENSDESSTNESSVNSTYDFMMKEEPRDDWEDVANESVDPGVSVKTENSDESSDEISIELETENVKLEPKPSLTTIYQATTVKEENLANDSNGKKLTMLIKKGSDCDNNRQFTIGEESSLTRQIETTNEDDGSHELEICKTENSDESSTNESSDEISIELEIENVKLEPKPSLTTIYQATTVKEENPANDSNGKKLTMLIKKGPNCDNNCQFTIGEESSLTRQIETTNEDDGSHELEICKTENSDESSTNESSANPTNDCISSQQKKDEDILIECESVLVKHEPKPSLTTIYQATVKEENSEFLVKTENSDESSTNESSVNSTYDFMMKEEPRDDWEDVANESVDPGVSVKTENSDKSSDEISIELETENVKLEPKPSLTTIYQATTVKEENLANDSNGKKLTMLIKKGSDCDNNRQFTIGEESSLTRQIETTNEDDGSHELEICKTENSDESSTNESSANPTNDCISSQQKKDEDILIDCESVLVKYEPKPSLTTIYQATVKEENPANDSNGKKLTMLIKKGSDCDNNRQFTIGEESSLTRQIETTNEDDGSHELEICKTENSDESSSSESSDEISIELETENVKLEPKPSLTTIYQATTVKEENLANDSNGKKLTMLIKKGSDCDNNRQFTIGEESSLTRQIETTNEDDGSHELEICKTENSDESSTNESSANPTNDCISSQQKKDEDILIDCESVLVKYEPKPSLTTIYQATVKEENPANDSNGKKLTMLIKKGSDCDNNRQFTIGEESSLTRQIETTNEDDGSHELEICKTENSDESSSSESSDEISIELETENVKLEPKPSLTTIYQATTVKEENLANDSNGKKLTMLIKKGSDCDNNRQFTIGEESSLTRQIETTNEDDGSHELEICKTENSDESSTNESSDEISIELEIENVKLEPKPSLTTIYQATTVKEENPANDSNGKKLTMLIKKGPNCDNNCQFTIGEESSLTRQIETTNEDDGSHELEICKTENSDESSTNESSANPTNDCISSQQKKDEDILIECESVLVKHEPKPSLTTIYQATVKEENSEFLVKTENSDESSTNESSVNSTYDFMMKEEPRDDWEDVANESVDPGVSVKTENSDKSSDEISIELETENVKLEPKPSLTTIYQATTVKEENLANDSNGKKLTMLIKKGSDCDNNRQFTIGEESSLTRQIETTNEDDGSHELEICKTENSDESSTNESSANPTNDCISSQQKKDEDILIDCESVLVKYEPKPSLTTIYQATVKEENPANDSNGKKLTMLIKKGSDCDNNRQFTIGEESSLTRQIETTNEDDGSHELEICKTENSDESSSRFDYEKNRQFTIREESSLTKQIETTNKDDGSLECKICHKSFRCPSQLKIHMNQVHDKNKPFQCEICNKSFGQKGNLKKHINTVHIQSQPFECDICHKCYVVRRDI